MNETAILFGPEDNLLGLVTPAVGIRSHVGVLILSAGVVHRVGPHRTSVKLARHFAQLGFTCIRFDVSGVGDSRAPRDAANSRIQGLRDTKAAMDWLEREHGIRTFALFGVCSGAVSAYGAALDDERVAGVFMVDGYVYPTLKGRIIYYLTKLRALGLVNALFVAGLRMRQKLVRRFGSAGGIDAAMSVGAGNPTAEQFATDVLRLTDRGVRIALLYTGSVLHLHSYANQLREAFRAHPFVQRITCYFAPEIDHTATSLASQQRLVSMATEWIRSVRVSAAPEGAGLIVRRPIGSGASVNRPRAS